MKTKWFNVNFQESYDGIYKAILNNPFEEDSAWGFNIIKYEDNVLNAKYIERVDLKEIIVDPFGKETEFEYFKYIQFNFWICRKENLNYYLVIESAPRSIKNFISNFITASSADFNVSNLVIVIDDFLSCLEEVYDSVKVLKVKLKGLTFSKHTSGDLEVESSTDALREIKDVFDNATFKIEKAKIHIGGGIISEIIEVNANGSISFDEELFESIFDAVIKTKYNK